MSNFEVTERIGTDGVKIVVVGVGGGNIIDDLVDIDIANKVKLVAINTDVQAIMFPEKQTT